MLKNPYIVQDKKIAIQIGRTVITFATKREAKEPTITNANSKSFMEKILNQQIYGEHFPKLGEPESKKAKKGKKKKKRR